MIRQALAGYLLSKATITNIVGTRVRPVVLAQDDVFPCITYRRVSAGHDPGISGGDNLPSPRFEIVCWAETYSGAVALNEVVRAVLEDEGQDTWTTSDSVAVLIEAVTYLDEQDTFADNTEGGGKPIFGVQSTYEIMYHD